MRSLLIALLLLGVLVADADVSSQDMAAHVPASGEHDHAAERMNVVTFASSDCQHSTQDKKHQSSHGKTISASCEWHHEHTAVGQKSRRKLVFSSRICKNKLEVEKALFGADGKLDGEKALVLSQRLKPGECVTPQSAMLPKMRAACISVGIRCVGLGDSHVAKTLGDAVGGRRRRVLFKSFNSNPSCSGSPSWSEPANGCSSWSSIYSWDPFPGCNNPSLPQPTHDPAFCKSGYDAYPNCCKTAADRSAGNPRCYPGPSTCHGSRVSRYSIEWRTCNQRFEMQVRTRKKNGQTSTSYRANSCGKDQCCTYCNAVVKRARALCSAMRFQGGCSACKSTLGPSSCSGGC